MNKTLAGFILQWRWYFKKYGCRRKKDLRIKIAGKFRDSFEKKRNKWTTEDFCKTYDTLIELGRI